MNRVQLKDCWVTERARRKLLEAIQKGEDTKIFDAIRRVQMEALNSQGVLMVEMSTEEAL